MRDLIGAFVLVAAAVLANPAGADEAGAPRPIGLPASSRHLLFDLQHTPGAAWAAVYKGRLYAGASGHTGPGRSAISPDTYFHAASITKPITAMAVMSVVETGRLDLNALLVSILPQVNSPDPRLSQVRIIDLLTHRSGIEDPGDSGWAAPDLSPDALGRLAADPLSMDADPGKTFEYSNRNYDLLAAVVEKVSGRSFEDFVTAAVLRPAGAQDAVIGCNNAPQARLATGHTLNQQGLLQPSPIKPYGRRALGSSSLCVSAKALALLGWNATHCRDGRTAVLACTSLDRMIRTHDSYGMGWNIRSWNAALAIEHSGTEVGYSGDLLIFPDKDLVVAVLANSTFAAAPTAARDLASRLSGTDYGKAKRLPYGSDLRRIVGRYWNKEMGGAQVLERNGDLWLLYQKPTFDFEVVQTRLFPQPEWDDGYYAGTFWGLPIWLGWSEGFNEPYVFFNHHKFVRTAPVPAARAAHPTRRTTRQAQASRRMRNSSR